MRNIPLAFVDERTLEHIRDVEANRCNHLDLSEVHVSKSVIAQHLPEIEHHKWFLGERLGRDVGTEVAAVDYFRNIAPESTSSAWTTKVKSAFRSVLKSFADNTTWDGPNSIANLERAVGRHRRSPMPF